MTDIKETVNVDDYLFAQNISEIFEQDSRRFNRALTEEQEALSK